MTKAYTSCIDTLPMAIDNVKRITYRHRGKYGKKKRAAWMKKRKFLQNDFLAQAWADMAEWVNLMRAVRPITNLDTRPINENIYKVD